MGIKKGETFELDIDDVGTVLTLKHCEPVELVAAENLVPTTIEFNDPNHPGGPPLGVLSWGDGVMTFEGNAEESAQVFVDHVLQQWNTNNGS